VLASGAILAGAFGAVLGSFLNVVAHRVPLRESVVAPRSRCPHCRTPIRSRDNVPVLSWLLLRGRCRDCAVAIPARYPLVELSTALLLAAVALVAPSPADMALGIALVLLLVPVTLIDIDHRIIPNTLMIAGSATSLALLGVLAPERLPEHLISAAVAGGFLLIAALAKPGGMGMGDVKLAAVLGLFLGRSVGAAMLVALVAGSLIGAAIIARKGAHEGRRTAIPFGPFLALGGLAGWLAGDSVVEWYLATFLA